ncbi:MAG: bifunctional phosphoribosylaminoimidazolecarboxamide formyltransferase/IMP cyclohydrolase [Myxococcales bacterium]
MSVSRALLSVSDKTGIVELGRGLASLGIEILSTGGTAELLAKEGIAVRAVSDVTGVKEMLAGRVKTLHPKIHGALLARRDVASDQAEIKAHGIEPIDLVVVNLYPFRSAVERALPHDEVIENIDIGGPAMIRSAAKNADYVTVIVDPADYKTVLAELQQKREVHVSTRRRLQARAFAHTAAYDSAIASWLAEEVSQAEGEGWPAAPGLPEYRLVQGLRYGENPHQRAAFYAAVPAPREPTLAAAQQLQGKELSFNNLLDGSSALEALKDLSGGPPSAVVVKHTNPCGAARAASIGEAYRKARDADATSAFGGIVAVSHAVDRDCAAALAETFLEAVIAPGFEPDALEALRAKKALRLLELPGLLESRGSWKPEAREVRSVPGGLLVQSRDLLRADSQKWRVVTRKQPTADEMEALQFAWIVVKHLKSNAIALAHKDVTVGLGMGQTNRVDSVRLAAQRAGERARGAALGSDAFFPFPDGIEEAARAGITAVAQPGGSVRDQEVIAAADGLGIAMVFTDARHFRH